MFKRAVITDEISQDFARAVEIAGRYGLQGVELRSAWDKNPHELDVYEIKQIKEIAGRAGMAIPCIAAPVFKCRVDDDGEYHNHLEILKRSIGVARQVGAGLVRGFTFWETGDFQRDLNRIAERVAGAAPILADGGVTMVLESDPATAANSNQKLAQVLALVASERIRALWDPGNNLYVPGAGRPFPEGYEQLRPYLAHVHAKDVGRDPATGAYDAVRLGRGEVGFPAVFRRLAADGYDGWVSLETHYRLRGPLSDELLALPKGSAFSLGGEEASLECLESWNQILASEGL